MCWPVIKAKEDKMLQQAIEELTQFWMTKYPDLEYSKARAWTLTQIDEAENGEA